MPLLTNALATLNTTPMSVTASVTSTPAKKMRSDDWNPVTNDCRSADEGENDAQDDQRDDEGDKQDQAQHEQADRARTIDGENAIENVANTERPQRRAARGRSRHRLHDRQCYGDGL